MQVFAQRLVLSRPFCSAPSVRASHNSTTTATRSSPAFSSTRLTKRAPGIGIGLPFQVRSLSSSAAFRNTSFAQNAGNLRRSVWSSRAFGLGGAFAGLGLSFAAFQLRQPVALCEGEASTTPATAPPRTDPTPTPFQPDDALPPPPRSSVNVYELGFGTVTGICAGVFIKKGAKALAFVFGGVFVLLQYLASLRIVRVDWARAESGFQDAFYSRSMDATGKEVRQTPTVYSLFRWIVDFLTADFQPRASFIAGLALGLRLG